MVESAKNNQSIRSEAKDKISLTLPNAPEYVSVARLTLFGIASRMGFNIEEIEDLKVAIAEACANAITHGCGSECSYNIDFSIYSDKLQIEISDKGEGFDHKDIKTPDLTQPREGGLGIFIIKSLMDEVIFMNDQGCGTRIIMSKNLGES